MEKRGERGLPQSTCYRFAPSCFFIFLRAKTNHFPANNRSCDSALAHWGLHACATATIMAPSLRQTLHCGSHVRFLPPFFYGRCVLYVFNAPLIGQRSQTSWSLQRGRFTVEEAVASRATSSRPLLEEMKEYLPTLT